MKTITLLLIFLAPLFVFGQITQIGADIDGEAAGDESGMSVSISADGSKVAIGAFLNDGNGTDSGHVRVYENTGGAWTQKGSDIDGEAVNDWSGVTVRLSADGSILAIGANRNDGNGTDSGQVRVYENTAGTWTQIGADIDGEAADDRSGYSLSLSADGSVVAVGAILNDGNGTNSGHVRVYQNTGGTWTQIGADIDGEAAGDEFGSSVSISDDGSIVAVSGPLNDGNGTDSGHVRVYENIGGTWTQIGADIDGEAADDWSGYWKDSVVLNADGSIVAVGSHLNDGNLTDTGHVRVYKNIGGTWTQVGQDIDGEAVNDESGISVSLSADGSIVAIGASRNDGNGNNSGHVRIYKNVGGAWIQRGTDIDGEAEEDRSGFSVSLSSDGSVVSVGAVLNDGNGQNSGHVRVFDLSSVVGIDDNSISDFSVYPNPTSGILNIESETTITQIEIYNLLGQLVKSNTNQNTIDISSVDQGIYFIKVMDENGNIGTKKVVKK